MYLKSLITYLSQNMKVELDGREKSLTTKKHLRMTYTLDNTTINTQPHKHTNKRNNPNLFFLHTEPSQAEGISEIRSIQFVPDFQDENHKKLFLERT